MQKTKKSIARKFKVTGTGKVLRRKPGKRHLLRNRTVKQKRAMGQDQPIGKGYAKIVQRVMPGEF